jgi:hypothetical protein
MDNESGSQALSSYSFKEIFLIEFTKELIRHSAKGEIIELKKIVEEETKKHKKEVEKLKEKISPKIPVRIPVKPVAHPVTPPVPAAPEFDIKPKLRVPKPRVLRIPEPRLPLRFQYLKPYATKKEIDLGKLNPLIQDPLVEIIEGNSPYENIVVVGGMGRKPTDIILSQEEMDDIVKKFSEESKIPVHIGIYKVVVGRLMILAIVSEVINSKFIIKKLPYYSQYNPRFNVQNLSGQGNLLNPQMQQPPFSSFR